jgi:hypothetical protein
VHRRFVPRTHRNALRDPQIQLDARHKFGLTCPGALFVESLPVPHEHEKIVHRCFMPRMHRMHYVTRISQWMQKRKFDVTCPVVLFMETAPVPIEHEKYHQILHPRGTRMHYVPCRYHQMQTHKFGVRYPDKFFCNSYCFHRSKKNSVSMFCVSDAPQCTRDPQDPTGCKNTTLT